MNPINVKSEIGTLKKVLVHRPGRELLNLTPDSLERLLFDDIPYLPVAQEEHDEFVRILRDNGVEVVYLEDLMTEVLDSNSEIREKFITQFIYEAGIRTPKYRSLVYEYLSSIENNRLLVLKTMEGIVNNEVIKSKAKKGKSLVDYIQDDTAFVVDPMPNLYFTRDPFASIGNGISLNRMYSVTRNRETIYAEYIFEYHPEYKGLVDKYFDRYSACEDGLNVKEKSASLERILEEYLDREITLIPCAGGDKIGAEREQWNDGSNTLCIAPGVVIVYDRNNITNELLRDNGIKVLEMHSAELSRGRGGPRCMSMPLQRSDRI